jgi:hypothetical protein
MIQVGDFSLAGVGLVSVLAMILNGVLPKTRKEST